ncbi:hypothetical protein ACI8AC_04705 [Geodermatophilus sp. SYSU D00758]
MTDCTVPAALPRPTAPAAAPAAAPPAAAAPAAARAPLWRRLSAAVTAAHCSGVPF